MTPERRSYWRLMRLFIRRFPRLFGAFTAGARLGIEGEKYLPPLSTSMVVLYGSPETLEYTDRLCWIGYFPEGDFSIYVDKKTDRIEWTKQGRII